MHFLNVYAHTVVNDLNKLLIKCIRLVDVEQSFQLVICNVVEETFQ